MYCTVTNIIKNGMRHLERDTERRIEKLGAESIYDHVYIEKQKSERFNIYRSAYQHYTEASTLYQPFLRDVLASFDAAISGSNVQLLATMTSATTTSYKFQVMAIDT